MGQEWGSRLSRMHNMITCSGKTGFWTELLREELRTSPAESCLFCEEICPCLLRKMLRITLPVRCQLGAKYRQFFLIALVLLKPGLSLYLVDCRPTSGLSCQSQIPTQERRECTESALSANSFSMACRNSCSLDSWADPSSRHARCFFWSCRIFLVSNVVVDGETCHGSLGRREGPEDCGSIVRLHMVVKGCVTHS
jgi:hypothetical protein